MDRVEILDQQGRKRDWEWLIANFGAIHLERAQVPDGVTQVYRIVKLQDAEGPAVQVANVTDQDGNSLKGVRVVRYWPDAPPLPRWAPPISRWHKRGAFGKTNQNGDIGFGMGTGDYYFAAEGGACSVWVADKAGPSDLIRGLGMLGGTHHRHLDIGYRLEDVEQPLPEKPKPPEETPVRASGDRWQALHDTLDRIIALLEERVG